MLPTSRRLPLAAAILLALATLVGAGLHALPRWFPQMRLAFAGDRPGAALPASIADLPLVAGPAADPNGPLAIILSGNGGWWAVGDGIAEGLRADGISTYGWNSLAYFVHRRSPQEVAADIGRIAALSPPGRDILLVGYSFGADVLATTYERLDPALKPRIRVVALIGLSRIADYAIGVMKPFAPHLATVKAIGRIDGPRIVCVMGSEEGDKTACPLLDRRHVEIVERPGGHHFDGDYRALAAAILAAYHAGRGSDGRIAIHARPVMMAAPGDASPPPPMVR